MQKISSYCEEVFWFLKQFGSDYEKYIENLAFFNGVNMSIAQIGEFANKLSDEFCENHNEIPWRKIYNVRNHIIHGYADIDGDILWNTIIVDIPALYEYTTDVLQKEKPEKTSILLKLEKAKEKVKQQDSIENIRKKNKEHTIE